MDSVIKGFSDRLKKLRKARKWSQKLLAEKLGVSTPYVNHLENGNRDPSMKTFVKIARVFGVSPGSLLGEDSNGKAKVRRGKNGEG